jgi:iron complex transport system ATP-binding protein
LIDDAALGAAVQLRSVSVVRSGTRILDDVDFAVREQERWVLLGPNGSGKTTLLSVIGMRILPTSGDVVVLGEQARRTDTRTMRRRIGFVSQSTLRQLRPTMSTLDAVVSGRHGALETWWHDYTPGDYERGRSLLARAGLGSSADVAFGLLSEGERQQVLLARALIADPELLLLDEPAAGLDLSARERLLTRLASLAADPDTPPVVLVTHHTEEIPPGITHVALMRDSRLMSTGPIRDVLKDETLSSCFGVDVHLESVGDRWFATAVGAR